MEDGDSLSLVAEVELVKIPQGCDSSGEDDIKPRQQHDGSQDHIDNKLHGPLPAAQVREYHVCVTRTALVSSSM